MSEAEAKTTAPVDPALAGVACRLGAERLERRLGVERFRDCEFRRILTTKCTWLKIHFVRPAERALLHLLKLWGKGREELLNPVVRENDFVLGERLPEEFDGFRILHLSDLHIDIDGALVDAIASAVARIKFDICVMTGDYRSLTIGPFEETLRLMARLRPAIASDVLCVLGNHDSAYMVPGLEESGYRVLLNEAAEIRRGAAGIAICGIDDPVIFKTHDLAGTASAAAPGVVKILLSHSMRIAAGAEAAGFDILLAGHTHGGQICLPGGWQPIKNERHSRKYCRGAWHWGKMLGYTTAGCGASGLACRLNCPSELVVHTLRRRPRPAH